ncbi:hypothetical protein WJ542_07830 [Paraburkholderia sp. B3]|uniref:hypothetical protein n=1 Tax=Paraburkholderia sp. B3 TaxID=3134791 RepID=UPI003981FBD0
MKHSKRLRSGYTAQNYADDVVAVLPFAFTDLHESGRMTTCAHCGDVHDGFCFAIHKSVDQGVITAIEIVAVCDMCAVDPLISPPERWRHVGETSGLFVAEENWQLFAELLNALYAPAQDRTWRLV